MCYKIRTFAVENHYPNDELMKKYPVIFLLWIGVQAVLALPTDSLYLTETEDIIEDICRYLTETDELIDYEGNVFQELQEELTERSRNPLNLYTAREEDLQQLHFLSDWQIEQLLVFVHTVRPANMEELRLVKGFKDWELRNLLPFVTLEPTGDKGEKLYAREVFHYAKHELTARVDARNIEASVRDSQQTDPVFSQVKYKFNYQNRVQFGLTLKRPTGAPFREMQYGGYVRLNKLGPLQTLVVGDYKASFGMGLVLAEPFHAGKRAYIMNAGLQADQISHYSSPYNNALRGAAATFRIPLNKQTIPSYAEISALYSFNRENDSLKRHTAGMNVSFRHRKMKIGLTFVNKFYSDTVRYYFEHVAYNQHYFRGNNQAVIGLNFRYNFGRWDIFGEAAAAQNKQWGVASVVGLRATPCDNVSLILLHRFYSLYWDNPMGYSFSETSRLNDENGIYLGLEIRSLRRWIFNLYGDFFRFQGPKYRINYYPSLGYDAMAEARFATNRHLLMTMRLRAREKAKKTQIDFRYQLRYHNGPWQLQTQAEANAVRDSTGHWSYGSSLSQDISYSFPIPLVLQARVQGFYIPNYDNRIYIYENDVLYAFSSTFVNGIGGRAYLNLRWKCTEHLSLYFRVSETVVRKDFSVNTRTDLHLLFRATF